MKRYMILAALLILGAACTKSEFTENSDKALSPAKEGVTVFSGTLAPTTKISMGAKVNGSYKALWEEGDELEVIKNSDGSSLGTATLTEGAGSTNGRFELPGTIEDGTKVYLVYGSEGVETEQVQAAAGTSSFQDYAYAVSPVVEVNNGIAPGVTLAHQTAVIKVSVSAASSLQGATVSQLIVRSIGGVLSGTDKDYVQVDLTTPLTLSGTPQDIWAVAAPYDATGGEIYVALVITKSGETYTLPIGFTGKSIAANQVSAFPLTSISDADCAPWYEPHDARLMPGPGYGYGEANCYLIQYKSATYTVSGEAQAVDPDPNIPSSVSVDYRARGDFRKVNNPTGATFEWVKKIGTNTIYNIQTSNNGKPYVECNVNSFSIGEPSNYAVTVTNTGAFAGAPILAMKKGGTVLWAWTLWNISADGTRLTSDEVSNGSHTWKLANMDIGQNTTQFANWVANITENGYPNVIYRPMFYYQWGRTTPIFWTSYATCSLTTPASFNVPTIQGPLSIEQAIATPGVNIMTLEGYEAGVKDSDSIDDWSTDCYDNLWGYSANNTGAIGEKSIYDPCPKHWRVPDPGVYSVLSRETLVANTDNIGAYYTCSSSAPHSCFTFSQRFNSNIAKNGRIATMSGSADGKSSQYSARWTNFSWYNASTGDHNPRGYTSSTNLSDVNSNMLAGYKKSGAMPVRCIADENDPE